MTPQDGLGVQVQKTVFSFVQQNKMFTAFDVTVEIGKQVGHRVPHHDVKIMVHEMFEQSLMPTSTYTRTLAVLENVAPEPWIYHPIGADPSTYKSLYRNQMGLLNAVHHRDPDSGVYQADKRGRLCIPAIMLKKCLLAKLVGVPVAVNKHTGEIFINEISQGIIACQFHYIVDKDNNIRLSKKALKAAGFSGSMFNVQLVPGTTKIKVTEV